VAEHLSASRYCRAGAAPSLGEKTGVRFIPDRIPPVMSIDESSGKPLNSQQIFGHEGFRGGMYAIIPSWANSFHSSCRRQC
jgi:hypothetical protein